LESTMDHSLPHVELWSIWKMSCNQQSEHKLKPFRLT
jgi:hypothetical protein